VNEEKLRKLLQMFADSDLEELEIQHSFWRGTRVKLGRNRSQPTALQPISTTSSPRETPPVAAAEEVPLAATNEGTQTELHAIKAPMVGTFYRASSPEEDPFVREGDRVEPGQTIFVVEAMKIMNEIEADIRGEIVEILVGDAEPVEYNQPLVRIRPS
jgi:acetyl-CoA carboxylase biotin carboxyl carrier protein